MMPRLRLTIGARERMELAMVKATLLGLLGTEAVVRIGAIEINGNAKTLRRLAEAASRAADLADNYDRAPMAPGMAPERSGPRARTGSHGRGHAAQRDGHEGPN